MEHKFFKIDGDGVTSIGKEAFKRCWQISRFRTA